MAEVSVLLDRIKPFCRSTGQCVIADGLARITQYPPALLPGAQRPAVFRRVTGPRPLPSPPQSVNKVEVKFRPSRCSLEDSQDLTSGD